MFWDTKTKTDARPSAISASVGGQCLFPQGPALMDGNSWLPLLWQKGTFKIESRAW